ncbi:MAG: Stealth CR1 domain-containing protein, partial [Alistipes sp.]|nr:Stealth CR1 domain-containing protein [Alistipes sp.]
MNDTDFVILWVDGSDPAWRKEFAAARHADSGAEDASVARYRDWRTLRYWFRSVERFAPWVRRIHFVTWGHLPQWLDTAAPRLHIVRHSDYLPEAYRPTFNSNALELNLHR